MTVTVRGNGHSAQPTATKHLSTPHQACSRTLTPSTLQYKQKSSTASNHASKAGLHLQQSCLCPQALRVPAV